MGEQIIEKTADKLGIAVSGCAMNTCKCGGITIRVIADGEVVAGVVITADAALAVAHELVSHAVRISGAEGRQLAGHA